MRLRLLLAASICLALGCQGDPGRTGVGATPKPKAGTKAVGARDGETLRLVDPAAGKPLVAATLIGKIRLIGDNGGAVVSNNGANIISNNGGTLIGKIRGEGAGLIGKIRYAVQQAAPQEDYLADARVEVLDAQGRLLADADGKPLAATSDKQGSYKLAADLPDENLILRVTLDPSLGPDGRGGALLAMLPRGGGEKTLAIDTASSVGAGYVLERLVKSRQTVYDRLPGAEAEALQAEVEAARGLLPVQPAYAREALAAAAEALEAKSAPVKARLARIRAILLAGQSDLGQGRLATEVTLAAPNGALRAPDGSVYVLEAGSFRVRKVDAQGRITIHAGTGSGKVKVADDSIEPFGGSAMAPDGTLYLSQPYTGRVRRIAPDGTVSVVPAPPFSRPSSVAVAADGGLVVGESRLKDTPGKVYMVKDGAATPIPLPSNLGSFSFTALAIAPDGTLFALDSGDHRILRRKPGEPGLALWLADLAVERLSGMATDAAGNLYLGETLGRQVVRIAPDGTRTVLAGTGTAGHAGEGGPATAALISQPAGVCVEPGGTVLFTDADGLVHRIGADGVLSTIAGTLSVHTGDATSVAINAPGGLAFDKQNQLVLAETASSTLKRLVGSRVEILAGVFGGYGFGGDGGPASTARLAAPVGLAYRGDELFVVDAGNFAIRRIDAAGVITTVAKRGGPKDGGGAKAFDPQLVPMESPIGVAIGPQGDVYWTDPQGAVVYRLKADLSRVEIVAGQYRQLGEGGDGGPARDAVLKAPFGLAFSPAGDLYVCDSGNLTVRKIAGGEPTGTITTVVGVQAVAAVGKLLAAGGRPAEEGTPAAEAALAIPVSVAFDPAGDLYVAELGTSLAALGERPELAALMAELPPIGARIRRVGQDGLIRTIAGEGSPLLSDPTGDEAMLYPLVIAFDREGRLVVADGALNQIKMLPKGAF